MFKRKYDKLERNFISIFNTICCCFDTYKRFDFFCRIEYDTLLKLIVSNLFLLFLFSIKFPNLILN